MSSRSPIQVPEELKIKVDDFKSEFNCKTHYEVIENLFRSHNSLNKLHEKYNQEKEQQNIKWAEEKERQNIKWAEEETRQENEMLQIGLSAKKDWNAVKDELGLKSDLSLLRFLLAHYHTSSSFDKTALYSLRESE